MSDINKVITALECADWSSVPIGNKLILRAALEVLKERKASAEPVGVVNAVENKGSTRWDGVIYASAILEDRVRHGTKLYTAPDALQAEGTTSDKYRAELYDEVWQKARDMGYGNVTDALAEVERLNIQIDILTADCASLRADRDAFGQNAIDLKDQNKRLREEVERLTKANEEKWVAFCSPETRHGNACDERDALKADANRVIDLWSKWGSDFAAHTAAQEALASLERTAKPEVKS